MAWVYVILAGILEIIWAYTMKLSSGFTQPVYALITVAVMLASFSLLALGMKTLPLGTAYAVWTGIGALGAFVVGIVMLEEQINVLRVVSACFILAGIMGLKLAQPSLS
jgi:quaternary ammonium compound-resistance protein SugE